MMRRTLALGAAAVTVAPIVVLTSGAAQADDDREVRGVCGLGSYELSVDREGRGFEVNVDLDGLRPGSRWTVVLRQDGKRIAKVTRRVEPDGDLDVERYVRDTAGSDTFRFTATPVAGGRSCGARLTV